MQGRHCSIKARLQKGNATRRARIHGSSLERPCLESRQAAFSPRNIPRLCQPPDIFVTAKRRSSSEAKGVAAVTRHRYKSSVPTPHTRTHTKRPPYSHRVRRFEQKQQARVKKGRDRQRSRAHAVGCGGSPKPRNRPRYIMQYWSVRIATYIGGAAVE